MAPENHDNSNDPDGDLPAPVQATASTEPSGPSGAPSADALVGVVVVTHGRAAEAMLAAARAILGRIPALAAVTAPVGAEMHALVEKISQACEDVDQGAGVLLLVDVHGSTPFHAAMTMIDGTRPAEVLCGVNLPMLIKLTNLDRSQGPPIVLAEELRDAGRRSIRLGSELTGKVGIEERR